VRSVWFKLFRSLDRAGADAARAAAPPPAPGAPPPAKDEQADHDYYRRFVEQFCAHTPATAQRRQRGHSAAQRGACCVCNGPDDVISSARAPLFPRAGWRKTRLCSRCFALTPNAGIPLWKVRLCSPCMVASVLNKSASCVALSARAFVL
jgi:hypothetical protein